MRIFFLFLSLSLLTCLAAGCGAGGIDTAVRTLPQPGWRVSTAATIQPTRKWTVLVYLNAANDLEVFGALNTNQMEQIGSTGDVNVVVQYKRIQGQFDSSEGDWGGTRRYFITKDSDTNRVSSAVLSENSSLDMGAPQTLQDFIQWGVQTYPAEHYCLVVWNHGAGWRSVKLPKTTRGVSYDDETSSHIDTVALPAALDLGSGRKWDLIAMDASLMQMAEVAYEIRDKASYLVGSEESPPGTGYPYHRVLGKLTADPTQSGRALGITFAQEMLADNDPASDVTQSVLDLSKVGAIAPALNSLGSALTAAQAAQGEAIALARDRSESYSYPENRDLLHFLQLLTVADSGVTSAAAQVQSAVSSALVWNGRAGGHPHSNGLAVFLPTPSEYRAIDIQQANGFGQRYSLLALSQAAPQWQNFLASGPP